jgi:hypothetical protein
VRLSGALYPMVLGMAASPNPDGAARDARLDVTLHDIAGGLASGIALLRAMAEHPAEAVPNESEFTLSALEPQVRLLRALIGATSDPESSGRDLAEMIQLEARIFRLDLDLEIAGNDALTPAERRLVELTCREGIRNAQRHSGTTRCRVSLDLTRCPFSLSVRDLGAGVTRSTGRRGGLRLLEAMATDIGARLEVISSPGLGVELRLVGPCCQSRHAVSDRSFRVRPRSVVAEESLASRKSVADRGPSGPDGEQISKT